MVRDRASDHKTPEGELVENRIVIWDVEDSRMLFTAGFYGKPLGVHKPKGAEFDAPLILDLIEAYYLVGKKRLKMYQSDTVKAMTTKKIAKMCEDQYVDFREKFMVYNELRESGFIVTPGIKFGCDFAIYKRGPGLDHAPYLVQVVKPDYNITATGIVLAGRLATTVRKQFTIALADSDGSKISFLSFDWWRA